MKLFRILIAALLTLGLAPVAAAGGERDDFEIAWSLEGYYQGGDELYQRGIQFNMLGRARWFDLWLGIAGQSNNSVPQNTIPSELRFVYSRIGLAGPWRVTPYVEFGTDVTDSMSDNAGGASPTDPTDNDKTIGLRYRVNDRFVISAYHRKLWAYDIEQVSPLPSYDRVFNMNGVSIAWEFGWSKAED